MNLTKILFASLLATCSLTSFAQTVETTTSRETRMTTAYDNYQNQPSTSDNSKYVRCDSVEKTNVNGKSKKVACTKVEDSNPTYDSQNQTTATQKTTTEVRTKTTTD